MLNKPPVTLRPRQSDSNRQTGRAPRFEGSVSPLSPFWEPLWTSSDVMTLSFTRVGSSVDHGDGTLAKNHSAISESKIIQPQDEVGMKGQIGLPTNQTN